MNGHERSGSMSAPPAVSRLGVLLVAFAAFAACAAVPTASARVTARSHPRSRTRPYSTAPDSSGPSSALDRGDPQLRLAVKRVDGPRRQMAEPGPLDGRRQTEARARRRRPRLPQPGPLLVALRADDRRQPLGLPLRPDATASATPRSTPAPTARTSRRSSTPPYDLSLAWYYTGKSGTPRRPPRSCAPGSSTPRRG